MTARSIRQAALRGLQITGAMSRAANSRRRKERLLILCYHGISLEDEHNWLGHLYIPAAKFERRLQLLRSLNANVLPLGEAIDRLQKRSLPPRSVAITFDDGFADFRVHAVPQLRKFGYPATLYLTTHYCRHQVPLFNLITGYLIWKSGRTSLELPAFGVDEVLPVTTYPERQVVVNRVVEWAASQSAGTEEKDAIARSLAGLLGLDYDRILRARILQLMNPAEVADAARSLQYFRR